MGADVGHIENSKKCELPNECAYLLNYWERMRRAERLSYREITAFSELTCSHIAGFEAEAIMNIDSIFEARNG